VDSDLISLLLVLIDVSTVLLQMSLELSHAQAVLPAIILLLASNVSLVNLAHSSHSQIVLCVIHVNQAHSHSLDQPSALIAQSTHSSLLSLELAASHALLPTLLELWPALLQIAHEANSSAKMLAWTVLLAVSTKS